VGGIVQEAGWVLGPFWTCAKNLAPTGIQSMDRPARSQSLYLLSYPAHAREENVKINYGMDTRGEKKKRTSKKNVDGRSTSSQDNKKFITRSMEKQGGMMFGFRKTATAVIQPDR
jgi:hypothetical protein